MPSTGRLVSVNDSIRNWVRSVKRRADVPAAGQQQSRAVKAPVEIAAQHRLESRRPQRRAVIAVLPLYAVEKNLRHVNAPSSLFHAARRWIMPAEKYFRLLKKSGIHAIL